MVLCGAGVEVQNGRCAAFVPARSKAASRSPRFPATLGSGQALGNPPISI